MIRSSGSHISVNTPARNQPTDMQGFEEMEDACTWMPGRLICFCWVPPVEAVESSRPAWCCQIVAVGQRSSKRPRKGDLRCQVPLSRFDFAIAKHVNHRQLIHGIVPGLTAGKSTIIKVPTGPAQSRLSHKSQTMSCSPRREVRSFKA